MKLEAYITKHESLELKPYTDSVGKITIGIGRNLDDNGISESEASFMLYNDIRSAKTDLLSIFPNFKSLPDEVQIALIDMMFNLGKPRFKGFKKMIEAIRNGDFKEAARQAKDSHWCKQVGSRCDDNYNLLYNA